MNKYQILVNILDQLCKDAPEEFKSYYPLETEVEKVNLARSKAFLHLYLKVKFGLLSFREREDLITDGHDDGGIDAYYIDDRENARRIFLIQAKFRTTEENFQHKDIVLKDLLRMDINRITRGKTTDEHGKPYNGKVQKLIDRLKGIKDIGRYEYEVVLLANVKQFRESDLEKLVPGYPVSAFDFSRCYKELVFPIVSGTYYNPEDLFININLSKDSSISRISYQVKTASIDCHITVLFVPTIEIAKVLYKYKNSILKYNPRSYLALKSNPVNRKIRNTVLGGNSNEFSLFNNGITMLSTFTKVQESTGTPTRGELYIKQPQIINGGQTAYTLSNIYEEELQNDRNPELVFHSKEVMLKIITISESDAASNESVLKLIEDISRATNEQTAVIDADRRSSDKIQLELQRKIFEEFGYFYERKRGEFFDGSQSNYINNSQIIDVVGFIKAAYAIQGFPAEAYGSGKHTLFKEREFDKILNDASRFPDMLFGYLCFKRLEDISKGFRKETNNKWGVINYGNALRLGKYAVIFIAYKKLGERIVSLNLHLLVDESITHTLNEWLNFEEFAKKQGHNRDYFKKRLDPSTQVETLETNFGGYYKGKTLNRDLKEHFALTTNF